MFQIFTELRQNYKISLVNSSNDDEDSSGQLGKHDMKWRPSIYIVGKKKLDQQCKKSRRSAKVDKSVLQGM